jgi:hypothetical protein
MNTPLENGTYKIITTIIQSLFGQGFPRNITTFYPSQH